jgi:putative DNA primase/helicase
MTTGVPLDVSVSCDRWRQFIAEIADDDAERAELLRLALGYSLTADVSEQVFFVLLGSGANGKSTLVETVAAVVGDYAGLLPSSVLTRDRDARAVQAEIAQLPGVRFARASELAENKYLDEGRIKALTGGDPISCAHKFGRPFRYRPSFKLWLAVNHRPRVSDRSYGFWRRAILVPLTRRFGIDKTLGRRLRDEAPGVLAWLVEAAMDWQRVGLSRPASVESAGHEWRENEDLIGQWAEVALEAHADGRLGAANAYDAFAKWSQSEHFSDHERPGRRLFGEWLAERFARDKDKKGRFYRARLVEGGGIGPRSGE